MLPASNARQSVELDEPFSIRSDFPLPQFETQWRHIIISTHRSWLHSSPRGFRTRWHRIHSSGDYKNPPPPKEHQGLHEYQLKRAKGPRVEVPADLRLELCHIIVLKLLQLGCNVLTVSTGKTHTHALAEVPADLSRVRQIGGKCKAARSTRIRKAMPGTIWGEGGKFKLLLTFERRDQIFGYISDDQERGAAVWTHQEGIPPTPKGFR